MFSTQSTFLKDYSFYNLKKGDKVMQLKNNYKKIDLIVKGVSGKSGFFLIDFTLPSSTVTRSPQLISQVLQMAHFVSLLIF